MDAWYVTDMLWQINGERTDFLANWNNATSYQYKDEIGKYIIL